MGGGGIRVRDADAVDVVVVAADQVVDPAVCEQPAVADDRHGVADLLDLGQDVRAQQDRHARVAERADHVADVADAGGVETVGRLVEDQQVGAT